MKPVERENGRNLDELRPVTVQKGFAPTAKGSVLIEMGGTKILCGATVEEKVPPWMRMQGVPGGWITAEYSMLPYASVERQRRESTVGRVGGRTQEIQRLIGRSLRAAVDLQKIGERTVWIDCDVIQADGGTRTASVTGGFMALRLAVNAMLSDGALPADPVRENVAAVSVGLVDGEAMLDLSYSEDVRAAVDMNAVMTASGRFVELQGTAESQPFSPAELERMLSLARKGIGELVEKQREVANGPAA